MTNPVESVPSSYLRGEIVEVKEGVLKAPHNIIQTISSAKALYYNARGEHLARINLYAGIEGLIAGNPPYDPAELARYKLSHISNFNNLDARALYERGALAYWNLLNESQYLCQFEICKTPFLKTATGDNLIQWAEIMSHHWDSVVRSWPSFNVVFNTLAGQLVKFGVSPVLWPDERDWRWRTIELSRFFVEDQAQSDIDLLTYVCLESIFTAQFLYEIYEDFKDVPKTESPWNIDELANLLVYLANSFAKTENTGFQFYDMMDIQHRIQNGDLSWNAIFSDAIRVVSFLYKEYDGKISNYMFHPRYDAGGFIYFADRQYTCMEEALVIFTASPGEFTIHSNRGLGHKIYAGSQAMMQLDCSIVDMARMSATPLIKTLATGNKDFEQIRFYPGVPTNIGQAEFVENSLGENIQQLIGASQYIKSKLQFNTANSGDDPSVPDANVGSISPTQARMQSYKEFSVLKNNIAHFYAQFDIVIKNMTIKLLKSKRGFPGYEYAAKWKERCLNDGVPPEIFEQKKSDSYDLPTHIKVKATRAAGDGSTLAKLLGLQEMAPIVPSLGPNEALEYKRELVSAALGPQYVDAFIQDSENAEAASGGASLAGVENAIMRLGESPVFSPDNENRAHVVIHLALANDTIRRIQQQQMTALQADKIFTVLVPHLNEHWQTIEKDPFAQSFVEQNQKAIFEVIQYANLNHHNAAKELQAEIEKRQKQQEQTQSVLSDQELKTLKTNSDIQIANRKVEAQNTRADQANHTRAEIQKDKAHSDADTKRLKVQLDAQSKSPIDQAHRDVQNEPLPQLRQDLSDINGSTPAPYDLEL